jgi:hypothetical protein
MAAERYPEVEWERLTHYYLNFVFTGIFTVELILKVCV